MIKKREGFRPFAPSIMEEFSHEILELPNGDARHPFMISVLEVRRALHRRLGVVTHVDGTARVQTVARTDNPRYWSLIDAFRRRTGTPLVLNTPFNNNAEPIVDSVADAVVCFLTTGLDYLVVGDFLVERLPERRRLEALRQLKVGLPADRVMIELGINRAGRRRTGYFVDSMSPDLTLRPQIELSAEAHAMLDAADGTPMVGRLAGKTIRRVLREVQSLRAQRAIVLSP
jgi:carbamoyltransferase